MDFEEEHFKIKIKALNNKFNLQEFEALVADFSLRRNQTSFSEVVAWLLSLDSSTYPVINAILAKLYEEEAVLTGAENIILFARQYALEAQRHVPEIDWSPIINWQIVRRVKEQLEKKTLLTEALC